MLRIVNERSDALPALADVFREHGFDAASLALFSALVRTGVKPDLAVQQVEGPARRNPVDREAQEVPLGRLYFFGLDNTS